MVPKIYCINLLSEPHRKHEVKKQFDQHKLEYEFVTGFDGMLCGLQPTTPHGVSMIGDKEYIHPTTAGLVLSHLTALGRAYDKGDKTFIVCEDDVVFSDQFFDLWEEVEKQFVDLDVIQLEYCCAEDKPSRTISQNLAHVYYPMCAACILWTRVAAEFAIKHLAPISSPYDILLAQRVYPFLRHAIVRPQLVFQRSSAGLWPSSAGVRAQPAKQ